MNFRNLALGVAAATMTFLSACTQIPVAQLASYKQAFSQAQGASEQVLIDYDLALKEARAFGRSREATVSLPAPYPLTWVEASSRAGTRLPDDIETRRLAFKVVADYNGVLTQLAEGKSIDEVKASASGLLTSADKFLTVAKGVGIPGLSGLTGLVSTLIEQFEKARLREEFVLAVEKGAPIVQKIMDIMIEDIASHYEVRATILNRERVRIVAAMRTSAETVQRIVLQYNIPAIELDRLETSINDKLAIARAEIRVLPLKIVGGAGQAAAFSPVVQAQIRDELNSLDRLSKRYGDNIAAMTSLTGTLDQYKKLLQASQASLKSLVKSLKEPVDIAASADEIVGIAFSLRRDLEEMRAARVNQ